MHAETRQCRTRTAATPVVRLLAATVLFALCALVPARGLEAGDPESQSSARSLFSGRIR
jgi:hypothetical protein